MKFSWFQYWISLFWLQPSDPSPYAVLLLRMNLSFQGTERIACIISNPSNSFHVMCFSPYNNFLAASLLHVCFRNTFCLFSQNVFVHWRFLGFWLPNLVDFSECRIIFCTDSDEIGLLKGCLYRMEGFGWKRVCMWRKSLKLLHGAVK